MLKNSFDLFPFPGAAAVAQLVCLIDALCHDPATGHPEAVPIAGVLGQAQSCVQRLAKPRSGGFQLALYSRIYLTHNVSRYLIVAPGNIQYGRIDPGIESGMIKAFEGEGYLVPVQVRRE